MLVLIIVLFSYSLYVVSKPTISVFEMIIIATNLRTQQRIWQLRLKWIKCHRWYWVLQLMGKFIVTRSFYQCFYDHFHVNYLWQHSPTTQLNQTPGGLSESAWHSTHGAVNIQIGYLYEKILMIYTGHGGRDMAWSVWQRIEEVTIMLWTDYRCCWQGRKEPEQQW